MSASRPHVFSTNALTNGAESAAVTETVIATLTGVTAEFAQQVVQFIGMINVSTGAGNTAVTVRVRRDSLAGALVDTADVHVGDRTASALSVFTLGKVDSGREPAGATYVVTVQGTGGAVAIVFNAVAVSAIVS